MKPTERDLMVARAVRDHLIVRIDRDERELLQRLNFEQIIEALPEPAEHEQAAQDAVIDCGDNSCIFKPSGAGGMRTNGGCRCYERAGFGASAVEAARKMLPEVLRLRREVSVAKREERERVTAIFLDEMQQAHEEQAAHPHARCINLLEEQHLVNEGLRAEVAAARAEGAREERERIIEGITRRLRVFADDGHTLSGAVVLTQLQGVLHDISRATQEGEKCQG